MTTEQQQQQQQQQSGTGANGTGGRHPPSQPSNSTGNKDSGGSGNNNNNNNMNNNKANKKKAARDRKKARDKLQKKDRPVDNFIGAVKDTGHLLYKHVINPSGGNMADQCRVFIIQLKLLCCEEKMFKLSSSITTWTIMVSDDFYSPMPDPRQYSKESKDKEVNSIFTVTNPARKMKLDTIWSKNLNSDIAEWKTYESFSKGLFGTGPSVRIGSVVQ
jgi:hypothetical protein